MTDRLTELRELTRAATPGPCPFDPDEDAVLCLEGANRRLWIAVRNALPALLDVAEAGRRLAEAVDTFRFAYQGDLGHVVIPDALAEMEDAARAWTVARARLDGGDGG